MWSRPGAFLSSLLAAAPLASTVLGPGAVSAQEAPAPAAAANPFGRKYPARVYETRRLQGKPPEIDGRLDDDAWKQGDWAGGFTQQIPTEGAPPSQTTELKILYDDRNVYFAIRAHDDPAKVHRYPGRRDDFTGDIVGVCFDSYNSKQTGFEFDLTAGGSKIDLILGNGETEWDTHVGPRLGRQGRPRREGLDGRVPRAPQPAALRSAGRPGLGPPRLALDRPQPGGGPVAAHPAEEHRADVPAR